MKSARLSEPEITLNKVEGFNFLQRESKKVYNQIINILKETKTKKPFIQGGFCKKIKDQIRLIEAPKPIRFYIRHSVSSVYLSIDTHYTVKDFTRIGQTGQVINYLHKDFYLCSCKDGVLEFSEGEPDFKEISLNKYTLLKTIKKNLEETYERGIDKYNSRMPSILR